MKLKDIKEKAKQYIQLLKHFQNPFVTLFMRLGWIDVAYCSFRIRKDEQLYTMLGRPAAGDLWLLREVLVEETYRPVLECLPSRPLRFVDIGAHIGAFSVWLHRQHDVSEAFCFEPDSDSFALCQFNLPKNGCENVQLFNYAIGGSTRESDIWMDSVTHARSTLHRRPSSTDQREKVRVVAFNEWLENVDGDFDLLKMDCEGSEWEIVKTGSAVFSRFSIIVAEIHGDPDGSRTPADFTAILALYGFTVVRCDSLYIGRRDVNKPSVA
jgi:FkbM family methyltransferase